MLTVAAALMFPLARLLGLFATAPIFSNRGVSVRVRLAIGLGVGIALLPVMPAMPAVPPGSGVGLMIMVQQMFIGIAIGFSDLFMVTSTAINQSGQTIELLFIMMAGFLLINYTIAAVMNAINRSIALKGYETAGR